ncbi:MAG: hypothetical protein ABSH28_01625 [Acidobacteriota bacterium]
MHDPLVAEQLTDKGVERLRVREMLKPAVEAELAFCESVLQSCPEFASVAVGGTGRLVIGSSVVAVSPR